MPATGFLARIALGFAGPRVDDAGNVAFRKAAGDALHPQAMGAGHGDGAGIGAIMNGLGHCAGNFVELLGGVGAGDLFHSGVFVLALELRHGIGRLDQVRKASGVGVVLLAVARVQVAACDHQRGGAQATEEALGRGAQSAIVGDDEKAAFVQEGARCSGPALGGQGLFGQRGGLHGQKGAPGLKILVEKGPDALLLGADEPALIPGDAVGDALIEELGHGAQAPGLKPADLQILQKDVPLVVVEQPRVARKAVPGPGDDGKGRFQNRENVFGRKPRVFGSGAPPRGGSAVRRRDEHGAPRC